MSITSMGRHSENITYSMLKRVMLKNASGAHYLARAATWLWWAVAIPWMG